MKGLLRKDLYTLRGNGILLFLIITAFVCVPSGQFLGFSMVYCTTIVVTSVISVEENSKWDELALMLPYSRRSIVAEKYLIGWISLGYAIAVSLISRAVFSAFTEYSFSLDYAITMAAGCALSFLIQALMLPLIFRFGFNKARILMLFLVGVFMGLSMVMTNIIRGVTEALAASEVFQSISNSSLGVAVICVGLPLIAAAVSAATIPLSVHGYKKRVMA